MNYNFHFLVTIHLLIATTICSAMENKPIIVAEFSTNNPDYESFITDDHLVINNKKECKIIDLTTRKTITKIINTTSAKLSAHPNKNFFALSDTKKITIYDTKTGKEKWNILEDKNSAIHSCMFSPSDDTLFVWQIDYTPFYRLSAYNYRINKVLLTKISTDSSLTPPCMDIHPKKPQLCLRHHASTSKECYHQLVRVNSIKQNDMIDIYDHDRGKSLYEKTKSLTAPSNSIWCVKYSPNGSLLATVSKLAITLINLTNGLAATLNQLPSYHDSFSSIEFHPNPHSCVLVALLLTNCNHNDLKTPVDYYVILRYFDIHTKKIISEISLSDIYPFCWVKKEKVLLSFSPNGKNLMVNLNDRCVILEVPHNVIYQPMALNKLLLLYKILDQHNLPHDIMPLFLEAFKR